jgi:adenylate kinase
VACRTAPGGYPTERYARTVKVLMLAPPGGGKGTQGMRLAAELGVDHISSGDVLRAEVESGTPLGREVEACLKAGKLAPDELVTRAVKPALARRDGYVLDGFPRTLGQTDDLDFDAVIYLDVPDAEIKRRLLARGRADDTPEAIARRLREYAADTRPLIDHYRGEGVLVQIDGDRPPDDITAELRERLGNRRE